MTADQFRKALLEQFGIKDLRVHEDKNGLLSFQGTLRPNTKGHQGDAIMMTHSVSTNTPCSQGKSDS